MITPVEPSEHPRIVIQGIGGLGGVIAACLARAGFAPALVTGNPAIAAAIERDGLRVTLPGEKLHERAHAYSQLADVPPEEQFDVALLFMKADAVERAAAEAVQYLAPEGYVVTFQNGIVEDAVAAVVGRERVVSGIIAWGGTMHAPGVYEKTSPGDTIIGELDGVVTPRIKSLFHALEHVGPVTVTRNIVGALWSKLAINCSVTALGAVTGQTVGEVLVDERLCRLVLRAYGEVIDTARAAGIKLENVNFPPRLLYVPKTAGEWRWRLQMRIVRAIGRRYPNVKPSMLQSLERGRKTEIEFLNGYAVEQARKLGIEAPVNEKIAILIREMESGARAPEPANVMAF